MSENLQNNYKAEEIRESQNPVIRWLLITGGFILIGVGIVGIFLPVLPTTIFFILAAWCFARSSAKFHHWLHHNRWFGKYLRDYSAEKGMALKSKIYSILLLWAGITFSAFFLTDNFYVRILLLAIAIGVTLHIASLKTVNE
jgi:uncharacterized membrane protein YbaN (DUF454 family)